jgi:cell division protein FtsI/penicillin-binding protein 2
MRASRRTAVLTMTLVLTVTGCGLFGDSRAEQAARHGAAFLGDWQAGRIPQAAARTSDPKAAEQGLGELNERLRVTKTELGAGSIQGCQDGKPCVLPFTVGLQLAALGEWRYDSSLALAQQGERWQVGWAPSVVHPRLAAATRLRRVRELPKRAAILDRDGRPLAEERPVVTIGIVPDKVSDAGTIDRVAAVVGVDAAALAKRVRSAKPDVFVDVITLRNQEYDAVSARLGREAGVITRAGTLALAPTRSFARGVLGAVTPATEQTLAKAGPGASAADHIGSSGLQAAFQQQLAGTAGGRIEVVDRASGRVQQTLTQFTGRPGTPLRTTLSYGVQAAAERALATTANRSALVAVDAATGGILAVANGPANRAADNRALTGRYPPGSTFKVVTTTALLRHGLKPAQPVPCPGTVGIGGRRFENYDGLGALGTVPFSRAFTESCNTAFLALAADLDPAALPDAAAAYGIGADWRLGVDSFGGSVPPAVDVVERAASAIGQGKVLVSPLSMAVVAAAIASGTPRSPSLLLDTSGGAPAGPALREATTLRSLMQQTVRTGTARVLALPGEPVGAKTGTAEYGTQETPRKHAWIIGFRGSVAFAVLVEDADTGAKNAGPVARAFLQALPR